MSKVGVQVDGVMVVGLLVGVPLLAFIGYKLSGAKEVLGAVVDKVNPASDKNLAYQGVNGIGSALTGDSDFTLGGWAYDSTHNSDGSFKTESVWDTFKISPLGDLQKVNPANPDNVINGGFNRVARWATGDEGFTLGGWVYDVTHDNPVTGAKAPINAVNPASDQNVIYKGVNSAGEYLTGDKNFTLGGWLYGVFND